MNNLSNKKVYSNSELLKFRNLEISKKCPNTESIIAVNLLKSSIKLPFIDKTKNRNHNRNLKRGFYKKDRRIRDNGEWNRTKPLKRSENAWKMDPSNPTDLKKIVGILNKLSNENYDIMVEEALLINYTNSDVVDAIFNKAVGEPFFSDIYAKFCMSLVNLHDLVRNMCKEQFMKKKHKNLCKFIGELYKLKLIKDLDMFVDILYDDLTDNNLEILCKLITTVGPNEEQFEEILILLDENKEHFKPRYKFMIMDVLDLMD